MDTLTEIQREKDLALINACGRLYKTNIFEIEDIISLIEAGANVNAKDDDGRTSLMYTCGHGKFDIVRLLIKAKANVNAKSKWGETALSHTKNNGYKDIEELLISHNAKTK